MCSTILEDRREMKMIEIEEIQRLIKIKKLMIEVVVPENTSKILEFVPMIGELLGENPRIKGKMWTRGKTSRFTCKDTHKFLDKMLKERFNTLEFEFIVEEEPPEAFFSNHLVQIEISSFNQLWEKVYGHEAKTRVERERKLTFRIQERVENPYYKDYQYPNVVRAVFDVKDQSEENLNEVMSYVYQKLSQVFSKYSIDIPFYIYVFWGNMLVTDLSIIMMNRYENGYDILRNQIVRCAPIIVAPKEKFDRIMPYIKEREEYELPDTYTIPMKMVRIKETTTELIDQRTKDDFLKPLKRRPERMFVRGQVEVGGIIYRYKELKEFLKYDVYYEGEAYWNPIIHKAFWDSLNINEDDMLMIEDTKDANEFYERFCEKVMENYERLVYLDEKDRIVQAHIKAAKESYWKSSELIESLISMMLEGKVRIFME